MSAAEGPPPDLVPVVAAYVSLAVFVLALSALLFRPVAGGVTNLAARFSREDIMSDADVEELKRNHAHLRGGGRGGGGGAIGWAYTPPSSASPHDRVMPVFEERVGSGRAWRYTARNRDGVYVPILPPHEPGYYGRFAWNEQLSKEAATIHVLGYGAMSFVRDS